MSIFDEEVLEVHPVEDSKELNLADEFSEPVAKKFAFIGCGAAGGRIVDEFFKKGYRRAMAANTCEQDRKGLSADLDFVDLSIGGAGKDPSKARECVLKPSTRVQLLRYIEEILGTDFEYVFICAGLGGGTGSGMGPVIFKYLQEYIESKGMNAKIGCILSLPMEQEGSRVAKNAIYAYAEFLVLNPTPMVIIDNARVAKIHNSSYAKRNSDANKGVANLLHAFNTMAAMPSEQTFDSSDLSQLLDSGMITFGVSGVSNWEEGSDVVARAIMDTFQSATLADVDISKATQGVCIVVAGENVLNTFSTEELMGGLDLLRNSSKQKDMLLHPAVYVNEAKPDSMRVYVALGGLKPNKAVFDKLSRVGNVDMKVEEPTIKSSLARFFGFE